MDRLWASDVGVGGGGEVVRELYIFKIQRCFCDTFSQRHTSQTCEPRRDLDSV